MTRLLLKGAACAFTIAFSAGIGAHVSNGHAGLFAVGFTITAAFLSLPLIGLFMEGK